MASTHNKSNDRNRVKGEQHEPAASPESTSRERLHVDPSTLDTARKSEAELQKDLNEEKLAKTEPSKSTKDNYKDSDAQHTNEDKVGKQESIWPEDFEMKETNTDHPDQEDSSNLRK